MLFKVASEIAANEEHVHISDRQRQLFSESHLWLFIYGGVFSLCVDREHR